MWMNKKENKSKALVTKGNDTAEQVTNLELSVQEMVTDA